MPTIHFEEHNGRRHSVDASDGDSVMRAALNNGVPGVEGDCGGLLQCATCHVYVDPAWVSLLPAPSEGEIAMIEGALDVQSNSRLSCQVGVTEALDGLLIRLPLAQS